MKGIKIKINAKFRASRHLCFEDTRRIMSPEMRPKRFGSFEKRAPGLRRYTNSSVKKCEDHALETSIDFGSTNLRNIRI